MNHLFWPGVLAFFVGGVCAFSLGWDLSWIFGKKYYPKITLSPIVCVLAGLGGWTILRFWEGPFFAAVPRVAITVNALLCIWGVYLVIKGWRYRRKLYG